MLNVLRVHVRRLEECLVGVVAVGAMHVAIVKVVRMIAVRDRSMTTLLLMHMRMGLMGEMYLRRCHDSQPPLEDAPRCRALMCMPDWSTTEICLCQSPGVALHVSTQAPVS